MEGEVLMEAVSLGDVVRDAVAVAVGVVDGDMEVLEVAVVDTEGGNDVDVDPDIDDDSLAEALGEVDVEGAAVTVNDDVIVEEVGVTEELLLAEGASVAEGLLLALVVSMSEDVGVIEGLLLAEGEEVKVADGLMLAVVVSAAEEVGVTERQLLADGVSVAEEVEVAEGLLLAEFVSVAVDVRDNDTVVVALTLVDTVGVDVVVPALAEDRVAEADSDTEELAVAIGVAEDVVEREPGGEAEADVVKEGDPDGDGEPDTEGARNVVALVVADVDHVDDVAPRVTTGRVSVPAKESAAVG